MAIPIHPDTESTPSGVRPRLRARLNTLGAEVGVASTYVLLTVASTYPLMFGFGDAVPGGGDSWQFYWNLWWVKRALVDLHTNPFFTAAVHYPHGSLLYFHTLNFLPSVLALPVVAAFDLTVAHNFLVLVAFVFGGYGTYRLTYYLLESNHQQGLGEHRRLAAFIAGSAFTFSSVHFVHLLGHLDIVSIQWLPLYVLYLFKSWREKGWSNPVLSALFLSATSLTSWYYAMYLLLFTGLFLTYHALVERQSDGLWQSLRRVGGSLGLCTLVLAPVLLPMLALGRSMGRVPAPAYDMLRFSADLLAFIVPSFLHPLWGSSMLPLYEVLARNGNPVEAAVFLGYVPTLLMLLGLRTVWVRQRLWLLGFVFFTVLALGPVLHVAGQAVTVFGRPVRLPYALLAGLPYADIPRIPGRFAVMSSFCLAILAGYGALQLLSRFRRSARPGLVAGLLVGLLLFENGVVPFPTSPVRMPRFYDQLAQDVSPGAILEVPIPDDPARYPRRMLYQTRHGKPTYGGYLSRGLPPLAFAAIPGFSQLKTFSSRITDIVRYDERALPTISRAILNFYDARFVVIDKNLLEAAELDRARSITEALLEGSTPIYEDETTLAYSVPRFPSPLTAFVWLDRGWSYLEHAPPGAPADSAPHWRWMGVDADLGLAAPRDGRWRLKLRARSFARPRRLAVVLDGERVATFQVVPDVDTYETANLWISAGRHVVSLRSLDGVAVPGGGDNRALGVAVFDLELCSPTG